MHLNTFRIPVLSDVLGSLLTFFADATGSPGLAIIFLTVIIRLVLYPLTLSQSKSMAVMRELQPKQLELQKKYKNNPQEYQQKLVELYQQHNVNPLGGCLPILLQLPILWALFGVLRDFPLADAMFLGLNLAQSATESGQWTMYILPALSGITTYLQMALSATAEPSQRMMMIIMPAFLVFISVGFPAGLVLYWVVSNVFTIGQQYVINRQLEAAKQKEGGS